MAERSTYEQRRSEKLDRRRLTLDSRVRRTGSDDVDADRRRDLIARSVRGLKEFINQKCCHRSTVPLQHLKARTASLFAATENVLELSDKVVEGAE